jgi:2-keto-4-pentenoate hydratase
MPAAWDDPRVARGMKAQLADRRARIAAGETSLGWKVGFGAQAAMENLKISAPLVGFLMKRGLVPVGTSLKGWVKPEVEPEIAIHKPISAVPRGDHVRKTHEADEPIPFELDHRDQPRSPVLPLHCRWS